MNHVATCTCNGPRGISYIGISERIESYYAAKVVGCDYPAYSVVATTFPIAFAIGLSLAPHNPFIHCNAGLSLCGVISTICSKSRMEGVCILFSGGLRSCKSPILGDLLSCCCRICNRNADISSINTPNYCLIFESSRLPHDCCTLGEGGRELECSLVILLAPRRGVANRSTTAGRRSIIFTSSCRICLLCLCIRCMYLLSCKRGRRIRRRRTGDTGFSISFFGESPFSLVVVIPSSKSLSHSDSCSTAERIPAICV